VQVNLRTEVLSISAIKCAIKSDVSSNNAEDDEQGYLVTTSDKSYQCKSLVVASGGLTMPKLGATPIGYKIAEQFDLNVLETLAALVPFTLHEHDKQRFDGLSGISLLTEVTSEDGTTFKENILFTHRGLSGPAILQISSFWRAGQAVTINLLPEHNLSETLSQWQSDQGQKSVKNLLATLLPKRFVEVLVKEGVIADKPIKQLNHPEITALSEYLHAWTIKPNGTEGYRTAEVTLGGVNTDELSSKTFESKKQPGLFFIGEVIDVTGWLGGYNFQFCWASGYACGQAI